MVARILSLGLVAVGLLVLPACESTALMENDTMPDTTAKYNAPYPDNISRNYTGVEGGSMHDPLSPRPIRMDYAANR